MSDEALSSRIVGAGCKRCGASLAGKRVDAVYCSRACRRKTKTCTDCGVPVYSGSSGRCQPCDNQARVGLVRYSDEEMLAAVREVAARLRRSPKQREFQVMTTGPSLQAVYVRFGSWNMALGRAGLPPRPNGGDRVTASQQRYFGSSSRNMVTGGLRGGKRVEPRS